MFTECFVFLEVSKFRHSKKWLLGYIIFPSSIQQCCLFKKKQITTTQFLPADFECQALSSHRLLIHLIGFMWDNCEWNEIGAQKEIYSHYWMKGVGRPCLSDRWWWPTLVHPEYTLFVLENEFVPSICLYSLRSLTRSKVWYQALPNHHSTETASPLSVCQWENLS